MGSGLHRHKGGKEDQLVKSNLAMKCIGPEPIRSCCIGKAIKSWISPKHRKYWEQTQGYRQTEANLSQGNPEITQAKPKDIGSDAHRAKPLELSRAQNGIQTHDRLKKMCQPFKHFYHWELSISWLWRMNIKTYLINPVYTIPTFFVFHIPCPSWNL